jgi:3-phenylpropionate/trans-cinnamate dioxygenase ferredoxin reductase component
MEYIGPARSWDRTVVRGSFDDAAFTVFYLSDGRVAAALTVGRSRDLMEARRLLAEKVDVSSREAELGDPEADLAAL